MADPDRIEQLKRELEAAEYAAQVARLPPRPTYQVAAAAPLQVPQIETETFLTTLRGETPHKRRNPMFDVALALVLMILCSIGIGYFSCSIYYTLNPTATPAPPVPTINQGPSPSPSPPPSPPLSTPSAPTPGTVGWSGFYLFVFVLVLVISIGVFYSDVSEIDTRETVNNSLGSTNYLTVAVLVLFTLAPMILGFVGGWMYGKANFYYSDLQNLDDQQCAEVSDMFDTAQGWLTYGAGLVGFISWIIVLVIVFRNRPDEWKKETEDILDKLQRAQAARFLTTTDATAGLLQGLVGQVNELFRQLDNKFGVTRDDIEYWKNKLAANKYSSQIVGEFKAWVNTRNPKPTQDEWNRTFQLFENKQEYSAKLAQDYADSINNNVIPFVGFRRYVNSLPDRPAAAQPVQAAQ